MLKDLTATLAAIGMLIVAVSSIDAEEIAAGTDLEARLYTPTGSRFSHPGDPVQAVVIAPIVVDGRLVVPQGAIISGAVEKVERLGLGLKHLTAGIGYRFDTLRLPNGTPIPIQAHVVDVETAKERVNAQGLVGGIYPTANVSSSIALYTLRLLCVDPDLGVPMLGIKFLIARSPDPEIYFPPGTEMILQLSAKLDVPIDGVSHDRVASLSAAEMADARRIVSELPHQRTDRGRNRPADLINILFFGDRDSISRAFRAAGWSGAQRNSLLSIYRIYHCMVQRMGYGMAPMGKLTLNGLAADAEYQKSLDTFSKRHHLRLWKQNDQNVWLGAATEDIGYTVRQLHLTHATDPLIDNERTKVLNDLSFAGCVEAASLISRDAVNAWGDKLHFAGTDGNIAVIRVNDCREPRSLVFEAGKSEPHEHRRAVQALLALENDIVRSNPISFASNTLRLLRENQGDHSNQISSPFLPQNKRNADLSESGAPLRWVRPSVLDETKRTIDAQR
jgi:hypothetical protein